MDLDVHDVGTNSQLARPESVSRPVDARTTRYPDSTNKLNPISLDSGNVFGHDNGTNLLATVSGDNTNGYAGTFEVGLAADSTTTQLVYADAFDV